MKASTRAKRSTVTNRRRRPASRGWRPSDDTVAQRVGDGIVLVHLPTDRIYSLNQTASRLWELLAARLPLSEIEARLEREFDVAAPRLRKEMSRMLSSFAAKRLVVRPRRNA